MAIQNEPTRISTPFADAGTKNVIPETMAQPSATAAASWQAGFPTVCSLPLSAGGIPPARNDFNGLFNQLSQTSRFLQDGGIFAWDASTDYGANRLVLGSDGKLYWSAAQSGPNTGAGAVDPTTDSGAYWGQLPVTATDAAYSSVAGGFVLWSNDEDYAVSQIVLASNGLVYMAKAASGPGTAAGAKNPATDTSHAYWVSPLVPTMPISDNSKSQASTEWVKAWYSNLFLPNDVYVDASSGNDSNDGLTASTAKKTIAGAAAIYNDSTKIKPNFATFHIIAGSYNEYITGVSNVSVRYDFGYVTTIKGVYLSGTDIIVYLTGRFATEERFLVANGASLFLGYGSTDCNINFDGVQSDSMLFASSKGSIRANGEGLVQMNFINGCTASVATVVCDLYGMVSFNHGVSNDKATLTGAVSGNKYNITNNSAIYGTGSTTYIIGSGNNNTQDTTSSYS